MPEDQYILLRNELRNLTMRVDALEKEVAALKDNGHVVPEPVKRGPGRPPKVEV